jgi:hypothetical protein
LQTDVDRLAWAVQRVREIQVTRRRSTRYATLADVHSLSHVILKYTSSYMLTVLSHILPVGAKRVSFYWPPLSDSPPVIDTA